MGVVTGHDFAGWATKFDIPCADGRTIRKSAFKDCDGIRVPMVWQHNHSDIDNVLGHAILEYRPQGVYAYAFCNDTPKGQLAKNLVAHRDLTEFSIYANKLVQRGGDVLHGRIRELSLVMAGANPEATIEFPLLEHYEYDDEDELEAIIKHMDTSGFVFNEETEIDSINKEEKEMSKLRHAEEIDEELNNEDGEETIQDVIDTMTPKQKDAMYAVIGMVVSDEGEEGNDEDYDENYDEEVEHYDYEGDEYMSRNVFDNSIGEEAEYLSHSELAHFARDVFKDMKTMGSFKEAFLAHAQDYGIAPRMDDEDGVEYGIDLLFPDYKNVSNEPDFIKRDMEWVNDVMKSIHHIPFTRVKTLHADITEDDARAKGYIKGNRKKEEVFTLLKRKTDPQTIYKKQKLDRDDIIDITTFDVVVWLRKEMRMMLEEEIARAILIGDGRDPSSDEHISEDHVRSVYHDKDLYTISVEVAEDPDEDKTAKAIIRAIIKNRRKYKGSGNPKLYINEDYLTNMLLLEDGIGHSLYPTIDTLATKLRVSKIVPVEPMSDLVENGKKLVCLMVNLTDYSVGADKGGEINSFEDFDIDYNQQKYLIETRISGALTKPFSAMKVELTQGGGNNGGGNTPTP